MHETDSKATISYQWTLTLEAVDPTQGIDADCDNHGVESGTGATFVWHHGNVGDPVHDDDCDHSLQGKYGHQGLVTVKVTDSAGWNCTATYKGTLGSDAAAAANLDVASDPVCQGPTVAPPPPPPTIPPKPCKCTKLTVRIDPASIEVNRVTVDLPIVGETEELELSFKLHWALTCDAGTLQRCRGRIQVQKPPPLKSNGETFPFYEKGATAPKCRGKCGGEHEGSFEVKLSGAFTRDERAGEKVPIVVLRTCQTTKESNEDLSIHFDKSGRPDRAKSKLK